MEIPSLRAIAKEAGVHHTTVSLALRRHPSIPKPTQKRIEKLAHDMGWRPNPKLGRMMSELRRTRKRRTDYSIAYFVEDRVSFKQIHYRLHFEAAVQRGNRVGCQIEPVALHDYHVSPAKLVKIMRDRGIDGVILTGTLHEHRKAADMFAKKFPLVYVGYCHERYSSAAPNYFQGALLALDYLSGEENYQIGMYSLNRNDRWSGHYIEAAFAYHTTVRVVSEPVVPPLVLNGLDKKSFLDWYMEHQPEALLSVTDLVLNWIDEHPKATRPKRFALLNRFSGPDSLASIDQNHEAVGAAAVDLTVEQILKREVGMTAPVRLLQCPCTFWPGSEEESKQRG